MPLGFEKLSFKGDKRKSDIYPTEKQENLPPVNAPISKDAPPSYAAEDPINEPSPEELNAAFANLNLPDVPPEFPTPEYCLAHLKLLNVFHALKEDIGYTDGLFGLWDSKCEVFEGKDREKLLARTREKRWSLYVARAVDRFEDWWMKVLFPREGSRRLEAKEMVTANNAYVQFPERGRIQKWTTAMLPPTDVLMVWHAFTLNPRSYLEDCIRFGLADLWATGMPWSAVDAAIDTNFNYVVPEEAMSSFVAGTGHNWNNVEDSLSKTLFCPRCTMKHDVPWTTSGQKEKQSLEEIEEMNGNGYGDRNFTYICHRCESAINHDLLLVAKFKKETENLIMRDWPLGGTILKLSVGAPVPPADVDFYSHPDTFPNRLIGMELRTSILGLIQPDSNDLPTMDDVKVLIERAIVNKDVLRKVNNKGIGLIALKRGERLAIRKMMSRYWENSSIFALELGGAVLRQGTFIDKMKNLDWLHSPAAKNTMCRLLIKYSRFIQIIADYSLHTAVPTLDVDLGWHTHQLSPKAYFYYTTQKCKKYIDHDDKMEEQTLSTAFEWTSKTYEKMFGEVYSECTCWYCEAIRAKHLSSAGKIFGTSKHEKVLNNFYDSGAANLCPPDNSAHISSHNAVKAEVAATRAAVMGRIQAARQKEMDYAYAKACKRAKAKGRPVPVRDEYYYGPWGYPYLMYGPFMAFPIYGGVYYAGDPGSMNVGPGMTGSCAAGTCSGGVAAGGCGGPGGCGSGGCGASLGGACGGSVGCGGGGGVGAGACGGGGGGGACGGGGGGCGGGGG